MTNTRNAAMIRNSKNTNLNNLEGEKSRITCNCIFYFSNWVIGFIACLSKCLKLLYKKCRTVFFDERYSSCFFCDSSALEWQKINRAYLGCGLNLIIERKLRINKYKFLDRSIPLNSLNNIERPLDAYIKKCSSMFPSFILLQCK